METEAFSQKPTPNSKRDPLCARKGYTDAATAHHHHLAAAAWGAQVAASQVSTSSASGLNPPQQPTSPAISSAAAAAAAFTKPEPGAAPSLYYTDQIVSRILPMAAFI